MKLAFKKAVCLVTACLMASPMSYGFPAGGITVAIPGEIPSAIQIEIPSELATVEEFYDASKPDSELIFHIQNLHGNYEAQKKIKDLLDYLHKQYQFNLFFVEGASEKLDPELLKVFPDEEMNRKFADYMAQKGQMTGVDYYLLSTSDQVEALGIEDPELYRKDYEAFKTIYLAEEKTKTLLEGLSRRLARLSSRHHSPETRRLLSEWQKFENGHREFLPYIKGLAQDSKKILDLDLESLFAQVEWPQLTRLLVLQSMEPELDREKAIAEKDKLLEVLKRQAINPQLLEEIRALGKFDRNTIRIDDSKSSETTPRHLLEKLVAEAGPKGFQFQDYPAFSVYAGYLILQSEIDSKMLFLEVEELFKRLLDKLTVGEAEKDLLELFEDQYLLAKLLHLELTAPDWSRVIYRQDWIRPEAILKRIITLESLTSSEVSEKGPDLGEVGEKFQKTFNTAFEFYEYARRRESAFYSKIQSAMSSRGSEKAVLVTGGFHVDGLRDLFRRHETSYCLLTPKIQGSLENGNYVLTMTEQHPSVFDFATIELISMLNTGIPAGWEGIGRTLLGIHESIRMQNPEAVWNILERVNAGFGAANGIQYVRDEEGLIHLQITDTRFISELQVHGFDIGASDLLVTRDGVLTWKIERRNGEWQLVPRRPVRLAEQAILAGAQKRAELRADKAPEVIVREALEQSSMNLPTSLRLEITFPAAEEGDEPQSISVDLNLNAESVDVLNKPLPTSGSLTYDLVLRTGTIKGFIRLDFNNAKIESVIFNQRDSLLVRYSKTILPVQTWGNKYFKDKVLARRAELRAETKTAVRAEVKNQKLEVTLSEQVRLSPLLEELLHNVFFELGQNALEAANKSVKISVLHDLNEEKLKITIEDDGRLDVLALQVDAVEISSAIKGNPDNPDDPGDPVLGELLEEGKPDDEIFKAFIETGSLQSLSRLLFERDPGIPFSTKRDEHGQLTAKDGISSIGGRGLAIFGDRLRKIAGSEIQLVSASPTRFSITIPITQADEGNSLEALLSQELGSLFENAKGRGIQTIDFRAREVRAVARSENRITPILIPEEIQKLNIPAASIRAELRLLDTSPATRVFGLTGIASPGQTGAGLLERLVEFAQAIRDASITGTGSAVAQVLQEMFTEYPFLAPSLAPGALLVVSQDLPTREELEIVNYMLQTNPNQYLWMVIPAEVQLTPELEELMKTIQTTVDSTGKAVGDRFQVTTISSPSDSVVKHKIRKAANELSAKMKQLQPDRIMGDNLVILTEGSAAESLISTDDVSGAIVRSQVDVSLRPARTFIGGLFSRSNHDVAELIRDLGKVIEERRIGEYVIVPAGLRLSAQITARIREALQVAKAA